ncbi:MAG: RagB/SusD family nutrient uptake outer membrane protein, partial [Duncaniella sp.]|nr:RagB/SusD family nutrient uptake outer membrane protein [Duncaniella sp.]
IKFNWSYDGCFVGNNLQRKTGDVFIMRMAEAYLIAAEAEQMLGNSSKAADYLNVLRQRSARPGVSESEWKLSSVDENVIFDEYARELCGEFSRWLLLKRHNAFETRLKQYNVRASQSFRPYMYNRPVSADFLSTILNANEYGDNGYGQTSNSGLENIDKDATPEN